MTMTSKDASSGKHTTSFLHKHLHHLASVLLLVVLLVAWQVLPAYFRLPEYILPQLSSVLQIYFEPGIIGLYAYHASVTLTEALSGLCIGAFLGFTLGVLFASMPRLLQVVYPYIVSIQAVPKVAVAPLFVVWLGFGMSSKVLVVALLSFFPVLVNTISGMRSVDEDSIELFRTIGASRLQTLFKLSIPVALPSVFSGLEIAVTISMIGAIVGEFVGAQAGLGVQILQAQFQLNVPGVFSILIILAAIGVTLNWLVRYVRRKTLFWMPREKAVAAVSAE